MRKQEKLLQLNECFRTISQRSSYLISAVCCLGRFIYLFRWFANHELFQKSSKGFYTARLQMVIKGVAFFKGWKDETLLHKYSLVGADGLTLDMIG